MVNIHYFQHHKIFFKFIINIFYFNLSLNFQKKQINQSLDFHLFLFFLSLFLSK